MKQNIPQMRNMLNEVVKHFSSNPLELRSNNNNGCFYNPPNSLPNSIGCAIGMYLPKKTAKVLEEHGNIVGILKTPKLCKLLPKWMQKMNSNFLHEIQSLHDNDIYWNNKGLTELGKNKVNKIKKHLYNLEKYQIKLV